jgi:hypothetical protein
MANKFPNPATRFKKGQSGNPLGRPSYSALEDQIRDLAFRIARDKEQKPLKIDGEEITFHEAILYKMITQAAMGDDRARKEYMTRFFGKPKETIELANREGEAFRTENLIADDKEIIKRYLESQGSKTTKE